MVFPPIVKKINAILILLIIASVTPRDAFCAAASEKALLESILQNLQNNTESRPDETGRIDPDRPHLPEASTAVGKGRVVLEGGYTLNERSASSLSGQDYPEALLRVGVLSDWFELRVGQNVVRQQSTVSGATSKISGPQDLYLGVKFAVTAQKRYLPEMALIPQTTVPTGNHLVTAGRTLPGLNVDGTWDIVENRYGVEFVVGNNRVSDDPQHSHFETSTGFTNVFQVTRKLEAFGEWDAFYPSGNTPTGTGARHYAVGGLVLFAKKNLALDFRAGAGLNAQANRFLIGTGFAVRH